MSVAYFTGVILLLVFSNPLAAGEEFVQYKDNFDTPPVWAEFWSRRDKGFRVEGGRLIASNSEWQDSYAHALLLTKQSFRNVVMQWTMVRLADKGDERAVIVAGAGEGGSVPENELRLTPTSFQVNQPYVMRLVVTNGEAAVYRRRPDVSVEELLVTKEVPVKGKLGFQHFNRYEYAYDNVCITAFSGEVSPPPTCAAAFILPRGAIRLSWKMPDELRGVFRYRIFRSTSPDMSNKKILGETVSEVFEDSAVPPNSEVYYQVFSLNLAGEVGTGSGVVRALVQAVATPGTVRNVFVCPNRKGGVTIRWDALSGEPVKEYLVLNRRAAGQMERVIDKKASREGVFLFTDPEGKRDEEYGVVAENVKRQRGAVVWMKPAEPQPLEIAGQGLNGILGVGPGESWSPPEVKKVDPNTTGIRRHPRLLYTQAQIERAKARVKKFPWAKDCVQDVLRRASQKGPYDQTFQQAAAYVLTGQEEFAKKVRETLLDWADRYRNLPFQHDEGRVTAWQFTDACWLNSAVRSYDLLYPCPVLSEKDKQHIEDDLFRPMADDLMINRRGEKDLCHTATNFQNMRIGAVGLTGFCICEEKYIRWAVFGPYGFLKQVASQVSDDGLWWEKSISYHVTTAMPPLYDLAEAAYNNNVDLWHTPVPDTCLEDYGEHYPVDGDNGPKTLKMAFDALLYFMFPDHTAPTFGDAVANKWYGGEHYYLAWLRYQEPRYAWFNQTALNGWSRLIWWDETFPKDAEFKIGTGRFANTGVAENGSTLFPSTGFAVLRQDESNPDAPVLAFTYGPYGGGHNHGDRLAYILYARGAFPVYRTSTYHQPGYEEYQRTSISYNTVVVDETSHRIGDDSRKPNTGRLDFFHGDSFLQAVGASADACYPDVGLRRALILGPDCLVDVFICRSANQHQYDYVLHVDSDWKDPSNFPASPETKLGIGNGYQDVDVIAKRRCDSEYSVRWPFNTPKGFTDLVFRLMPIPETTIFACQSPGCMKHQPLRSMFVARRQARNTVFVSVMEIRGDQPPITTVEPIEITESDSEGVRVGLRLQRETFTDMVLYSEKDGLHQFDKVEFNGRAAWIRIKDDAVVQSSVVQALEIRCRNLSRRYGSPTSTRILEKP
ncbi:MAG: heparinase II/III family protein [Verrucomicrobia bacterium]|nr:heparinase II/III family protein [Verrucomicrobiota bacterium]